ncbi:MAG TPA: AAA family ATPase, partial [Rectinemataceae bacterium]|nr:AAA family ATPase [Rectinemataceae bacterium]
MRPHRLVLENFGAYRRRTSVDFDGLGPLFLVWGKTGSGKTTLFDAMTYALYGKAPGSRAGLERQLWSHHAELGERPLVELEFSLAEREYRVQRIPPYRRRKRGGEAGEAPAEAALWRRDPASGGWESVADKITEVDSAIQRGIGLTVDEFSKIILLPQGEFQRFLEMDSTERVTVLEKLFPVQIHDAVTRLARDRSRIAAAGLQRLTAELDRLVEGRSPEEDQAALEESTTRCATLISRRNDSLEALSQADSALRNAQAAAERARKARAARFRLEGLEAEADNARRRRERIAAARAARPLVRLLDELDSVRKEHALLQDELAARAGLLAEIESHQEEMAALKGEARRRVEANSALDREIGELERAADAWAQVVKGRERIEVARAQLGEVLARERARAERETSLRVAHAQSRVSPEEELDLRQGLERARGALAAAQEQLRLASELDTLARAAAQAEGEAESLEREAEVREGEASAMRLLYEDLTARTERNHARALARALVEGQPCPVCGSTEHPSPAAGGEESLDDPERIRGLFDGARDLAAAARGRAEAAREAAAAARDRHENRRAASPQFPDLESLRSELGLCESAFGQATELVRALEERRGTSGALERQLEAARVEGIQAAQALLGAREALLSLESAEATLLAQAGGDDPAVRLAAARDRRVAGAAELESVERKVREWSEGRERVSAQLAETRRRLPLIERRLEDLLLEQAAALEKAGFDGPAALRASALPDSELAELEKEAEAHGQALAAARAEMAALAGDEGLDTYEQVLESLAESARSARLAYDEISSALEAAQADRSRLESRASERERLTTERSELELRYAALNSLALLLNGELPGRRLPFKHFVLGMYFRIVVERASLRLAQLSDGRYALVADEGSSVGRGKVGLDLLVRDSYTGQSRAAGTLSGGERFLTALALALGLADTIRDRSGAAALEAIFIDEGFGSLDDEALDRAITALDEVRGARTIGIVSHVAELRTRIPSR